MLTDGVQFLESKNLESKNEFPTTIRCGESDHGGVSLWFQTCKKINWVASSWAGCSFSAGQFLEINECNENQSTKEMFNSLLPLQPDCPSLIDNVKKRLKGCILRKVAYGTLLNTIMLRRSFGYTRQVAVRSSLFKFKSMKNCLCRYVC